MSRLDDLTALHASLRRLLEDPRATEGAFQAWFEQNPLIFEVLGYRRWIPKPRLRIDGDRHYEPDFVVQDHAGVWSIFELKRPDTVTLKNPERRTDMRAEFSSYVRQCREYASFFLEASQREQVRRDYGIEVQTSVPSVVVASVDELTDTATLREILWDQGNKAAVLTYSALLDTIARTIDATRIDNENLEGLYVAILGHFPRRTPFQNQILFDFGSSPVRNRLTIGCSPNAFAVRLLDDDGREHASELRRPMIVEFANAHELTLLEVVVGSSNGGSYLGAFLDRRCVLASRSQRIPIRVGEMDDMVVGSDLYGATQADFALVEAVRYARTLAWRERQQLYAHIDEVYGAYLSPCAIFQPGYLLFKGNRFMSTAGHTTCPGSAQTPTSKPTGRSAGPWGCWSAPTGVQLADGSVPVRDSRLGKATIPLPGMDSVPPIGGRDP